jgi:hypothetical protein
MTHMCGVSVDDGLHDAEERRTVGGSYERLLNVLKSPLVISNPHPRQEPRVAVDKPQAEISASIPRCFE